MELSKIVVVGSGTMGAGIGQLCAQKGISVTVTDINQEFVDNAKKLYRKRLG